MAERIFQNGSGAAWAAACASCAAFVMGCGPDPEPQGALVVSEGTNIAATVSPDQQHIIFDWQGVLWSLPANGGDATALTDPFLEPARPHWSPAGDRVAFQAYAGGTFHIWLMNPDGTGLQQLTDGHGDDREPRFSPDGARVAFSSDRAFAGSYDVWVADVATGALSRWTSAATDEFEPDWLPDGSAIAYVVGSGALGTRIDAADASGAVRTWVAAPSGMRLSAPAISPDGQSVAYTTQAALTGVARPAESRLMISGEPVGPLDDVFPFPAHWLGAERLLYTANGKIQVTRLLDSSTRSVEFRARVKPVRARYQQRRRDFDGATPRRVKGIVGPVVSPDGQRIAFEALNQIWVMRSGEPPRALTTGGYYKADPAWSPDGRRLVYSSDQAGTPDLYIVDVRGGVEQRVTALPGAEVAPAWSPDGQFLAFQDQTAATHVVEIATGNVRQLITSLFAPSKPSWHPSGSTLALAALRPYTRRFREGTSQILTVDTRTGATAYHEPAPFESISTRGNDGPVYSPDGTAVAFVMQSALWVKAVDAAGIPYGEAVRLNDEATDAPSWSGDSQTLVYLSNGKLRSIARTGGVPRELPLELEWQPEMPTGRTVVHAGKLWNGLGPDVLTDVDVVIDGHRISAIAPHAASAHESGNVIDASGQTVLPGLWEAHTHQWISGKFYGDRLGRLWLAYGVTSLASQGDPAYHAVETMEAFASGQRLGPRFFPSGEAIDGERIYYNFMRPVTGGDEQLARELSRAEALGFDMIKAYVRLSHRDHAKVAAFAHERLGVHVGSHYLPVGMAYGLDAITHICCATTRSGFAYTRSAISVSYADVRELLSGAGMFGISTTVTSALYGDDPGMVDDPRLITLNTPWDQIILQAKRDAALATDQTLPLLALQKEEDTVRAVLDAGGVILAGTDSPLDDVATALHLNLRSQVKLGSLPPWRALQTATRLPAERMGVGDELGTLEPGKLADLVIVDGDPLEEIADVARVQAVMKNGRAFTIDELLAPFRPGATVRDPATVSSAAGVSSAAAGIFHRQLAPAPEVSRSARTHWWHDPAQFVDDEHR